MKKIVYAAVMVLMVLYANSQNSYEINIVPELEIGEYNKVIEGRGCFVEHNLYYDDTIVGLKVVSRSVVNSHEEMVGFVTEEFERLNRESGFMCFAVFVSVFDSTGVVYEYDKHCWKGGERFAILDVDEYVCKGVKEHEQGLRYVRSGLYGGDFVTVYTDGEGELYYWNRNEKRFLKME